jgi:hypothetical protein
MMDNSNHSFKIATDLAKMSQRSRKCAAISMVKFIKLKKKKKQGKKNKEKQWFCKSQSRSLMAAYQTRRLETARRDV